VTELSPRVTAQELEELLHQQGFQRIAVVSGRTLPKEIAHHPQIVGLGEGSFVLAGLSCYREEPEDLSEPGEPHALIAPFARRNYYAEAVQRLKIVVRSLCGRYGLSKRGFRIFCNSRLPEKALALASGLGSFGKNCLILAPELGSVFLIAGLFVPLPVEGSAAAATQEGSADSFPLCGPCRACQDSCPVDALRHAGRLDHRRCLQALCTEPIPFSEGGRLAWKYRLYGCQVCQEVCPYNKTLSVETYTHRGEIGASLPLRRLLSLDGEEIKVFFHGSTLDRSWIPAQSILRNALLAAGNRRDPALSDLVCRYRSSPDPLVAHAAAWAAARIEGAVPGGRQ
jgi:epoxyqueuosine reductase